MQKQVLLVSQFKLDSRGRYDNRASDAEASTKCRQSRLRIQQGRV